MHYFLNIYCPWRTEQRFIKYIHRNNDAERVMKLAFFIIHSINLTQYSIYFTSRAIVFFFFACRAVFISYLNDLIYVLIFLMDNQIIKTSSNKSFNVPPSILIGMFTFNTEVNMNMERTKQEFIWIIIFFFLSKNYMEINGKLSTFISILFFSERDLKVGVISTCSAIHEQEMGVSQGIILAVTLLNIEINSLAKVSSFLKSNIKTIQDIWDENSK